METHQAAFLMPCSNYPAQLSEQPALVKQRIILTPIKHPILHLSNIARQKCCNTGVLSDHPGREGTKQQNVC